MCALESGWERAWWELRRSVAGEVYNCAVEAYFVCRGEICERPCACAELAQEELCFFGIALGMVGAVRY